MKIMRTIEELKNQCVTAIRAAQSTNPLVPSITNPITINFVANAQLSVGGSAAMIYLPDEALALAAVGAAFYINMGGILPIYAKTLPLVAKRLHETKTQWVLDPVGIGVGKLRQELLMQFKDYQPSIIRGNASEIIALADLWSLEQNLVANVRGVDAGDAVFAARKAAAALAIWTGGAVMVSGEQDLVTDGKTAVLCTGGSHFMTKVTGAGCSLGGVAAVYAAVSDPFIAALTGTLAYNAAGKRAALTAAGPGSFQANFLDELYNITAEDILASKIEMEEANK